MSASLRSVRERRKTLLKLQTLAEDLEDEGCGYFLHWHYLSAPCPECGR